MVDDRSITSNALVPVRSGGPKARRVVQIVLLELFTAAQVLVESLRAVDFSLDQRANRVVGTPVQILVDTVHAAGKSTGKERRRNRFCGRLSGRVRKAFGKLTRMSP